MSPLDDFARGITVLNFSICPFVQRITTVLHSYNIHFDSYSIDIYDQKPEWFIDNIPSGKVPALCLKGEVLNYDFGDITIVGDSMIILSLLNELLAEKLMPKDSVLRTKHRKLFALAEELHSHSRVLLIGKESDEINLAIEKMALSLKAINDELSVLEIPIQENISMLEAILSPLFNLIKILQSWYRKDLFEGYTHTKAWQEHLCNLPPFQQALPHNYELLLLDFVCRSDGYLSTKLANKCSLL